MDMDFLFNMTVTLSSSSLHELVSLLDRCSVCPGNPDKEYVHMVEYMKGRMMSNDRNKLIATVTICGKHFSKNVCVMTWVLVSEGKCKTCVQILYAQFIISGQRKILFPHFISSRQQVRSRLNILEKTNQYSFAEN